MVAMSIFARLIIIYLSVFIPIAGVNLYNILQLHELTNATYQIFDIETLIKDYEKKLGDSILSQVRYERKFIITRDNKLYDQFLLAESEFSKYLRELMSIADTQNKQNIIRKIKGHHDKYITLFKEEAGYLKTNKHYSQNLYKQQKEKVLKDITEGLIYLKSTAEQDTHDKIRKLREDGDEALRLAVVLTIVSLLFGIIISSLITRSITKPLNILEKKTKEIAGGNFEGNLKISSPPEIAGLSQAFNLMCNKLSEIDKMKADFFSLMAHELRTPLTSIKEGTNLMRDGVGGDITEKQKRLLTIISEQSNRLIELVNSLLDLSKIEAGMVSLNFENSDIKSLIAKSVAEMEPLALSKEISLKIDIIDELPNIKIDKERIHQVLLNLISNAVKFTPAGGDVTVTAQKIGQEVQVSVRDTGAGIPEENLNAIFEKFKQTNTTGYNTIKGTGLGLAIVKHIIIAHGGRVWAESKIGYGSTFTFALPV